MSEYLNNAKNTVQKNLPSAEAVSSGISNAANSIRETTKNATADFSAKGVSDAGKEFLNSNSLIARFAFIVLVLIAFMILLNLGMSLVAYFTTPNANPYIIHGMLPGTSYAVFPQDPANGKGVVYRSNNKSGGAEFTWSMWLKLDSLPTNAASNSGKRCDCIFVKGTDDYDLTTGYSNINNGPGLYLDSSNTDTSGNSARLVYIMDTVAPMDSSVNQQNGPVQAVVPNLPLSNWFHVAIRLQNKTLDCYINGVITKRVSFGDYVPKQNYDPIVFAGNGGFGGAISNLRYYSYALSVYELNSIVYYGPNLKSASQTNKSSYFDYLGKSWYKAGQTAQ